MKKFLNRVLGLLNPDNKYKNEESYDLGCRDISIHYSLNKDGIYLLRVGGLAAGNIFDVIEDIDVIFAYDYNDSKSRAYYVLDKKALVDAFNRIETALIVL